MHYFAVSGYNCQTKEYLCRVLDCRMPTINVEIQYICYKCKQSIKHRDLLFDFCVAVSQT